MPLTAIEGVVENGKIRFTENISLPENARVYVIVTDASLPKAPRIRSPHFVDRAQAALYRKQVVELPPNDQL